jgi:CBS domain-containing protein
LRLVSDERIAAARVVPGNQKSSEREAKMASKRHSKENVRKARRSADLGEEKAKLEKASREEVRKMQAGAAERAQQRSAQEADLGQKEARLEKASDEELEHMGSSEAAASARQRRSTVKVQMAMHKGVEWVGPETPITEIARLMRKHDIGAIPIGENDHLIGMVTDRDIVCKGLAEKGFDASRATARDVMSQGIHCCREDDDLSKAVQHMEQLQIRRLPVINTSKRLVGMLSIGDIGRAAPSDVLSECVRSVSAHHS